MKNYPTFNRTPVSHITVIIYFLQWTVTEVIDFHEIVN